MTRFAAIFAISLAMPGAAAVADPSLNPALVLPGSLHGAFDFRAMEQKPGETPCRERWQFGDDGTLTIMSGDEIVTGHFRVELRETDSTFAK